VLVANPGILAAGLIHERFGVPWTNLVLQPWMIPSTLAPPLLPGFTWLARAPRPAWQVFSYGLELVVDLLVGRDLNRLRARIGLPPTRRVIRHWLSKELVIGMFPEWFGLTQADWPSQVRLAGFPLFDGGQADALPGDVLEFCRAGAPPVAFTFGTGMAHPAHLFRAAVEACEILGVRGILLTKYRDQLPDPLPASVLPCAFAPFQELFPRCAAVLHHGGIGTTAKALASGTPQLVHPLCFDQIDNGMRVQRLGVGVCLRVRRPSGRQIATALAPLMTEEFRATARRLKARFQGADALVAAAELVESLAPHSVPSDVSRI
jgi:UDP:flavonoid glycosyltransferase YjiC (YdhE family)